MCIRDRGVIEVLDVLGRSVQVDARPSTGGSMQVQLSLPSPGLFTVRMSNGADVAFTKVLISER